MLIQGKGSFRAGAAAYTVAGSNLPLFIKWCLPRYSVARRAVCRLWKYDEHYCSSALQAAIYATTYIVISIMLTLSAWHIFTIITAHYRLAIDAPRMRHYAGFRDRAFEKVKINVMSARFILSTEGYREVRQIHARLIFCHATALKATLSCSKTFLPTISRAKWSFDYLFHLLDIWFSYCCITITAARRATALLTAEAIFRFTYEKASIEFIIIGRRVAAEACRQFPLSSLPFPYADFRDDTG